MIAHVPTPAMQDDDWLGITYSFTRNVPKNTKNEAETAAALAGIVSKETQLSTLSIIKDPKAELEKINQEEGLDTVAPFVDRGDAE